MLSVFVAIYSSPLLHHLLISSSSSSLPHHNRFVNLNMSTPGPRQPSELLVDAGDQVLRQPRLVLVEHVDHPIHQSHGPGHRELHHGARPGDVGGPLPLLVTAWPSLQVNCRPENYNLSILINNPCTFHFLTTFAFPNSQNLIIQVVLHLNHRWRCNLIH